ncbi:zinc finger HIT domain-containing protein 3 isoform X2 [Echeneis naucrates]|uniref:zinc finger HIT domain-containing protein 3 isoform X2 n=1 Tax=Echeneis naucrates TaxID=173247 RepID=UPI00111370F5|nr:zinc finger HIT domain-containing protein 3 isoform X2 [Echeneis naucrates]
MQICGVCSEQIPKYRCPICKIRYCSLGCYKRHKGKSKELRDLLCNPHLRQLLRSIDNADNKANAMKHAMQEPLFVEFSDQCLKIVESETKSFTYNEDDDDL